MLFIILHFQSTEVFDLVRTDLEEFGSVVKSEVNGIVSSTGSVVEKALKVIFQ